MKRKAFIYQIDKGDYDWIFIISKDKLDKKQIKNLIIEKYDDFFLEIDVFVNELYFNEVLKDFNTFDNVIDNMKHFTVINLTDINLEDIYNKGITKEIDRYKIKMPINNKNKWEYYENIWHKEYCPYLFEYNGAMTMLNDTLVDEIIEFLQKLKKEWKDL